ncbi:MAG: corrinoid protein [Clostridia bacterium]
MSILEDLSLSLQDGDAAEVVVLVKAALAEGLAPKTILEEGMLSGMNIIGVLFKNNEVFVPEVLIAARAMNAGIEILKPHLIAAGVEDKGTVVLGTVKGDLHDIGKNLVKMMMEGKGLKVIDLGVDVNSETFIDAAITHNAKIIACSALLTTTMNEMKNVMALVIEKGLQDKVKVMIGGAPISQSFCDQIGASSYTPDAASAADQALAYCL